MVARKKADDPKRAVPFRLPASVIEAVDKARGELSRQAWLEQLVVRELGGDVSGELAKALEGAAAARVAAAAHGVKLQPGGSRAPLARVRFVCPKCGGASAVNRACFRHPDAKLRREEW